MMNISLPIYNVRQSSSNVISPRWQKIVPACASKGGLHLHQPIAASRGLRLWLLPRTRTSTREGYARAGKLSTQSHYRIAEMHVTQAVSSKNIRSWISMYVL